MKVPPILSVVVFTGLLVACGVSNGRRFAQLPPDFSLQVTSANGWSGGGSGSATIVVSVVSQGGFSGTVNLTMTTANLPSGVSGTFSHTTVNAPGSSTVTLTSTSGKPAIGNYPFTITGASGSLTHSTDTSLFVPGPVNMEALIGPGAMEGPDGGAIKAYIQANPIVKGATFQVEWGSIDHDGNPNDYNWSYTDSLIQPWISAGREINFVFWANSDSATTTCGSNPWSQYGEDGTGNCAIPAYVWTALGSSNYVTCTPQNASGPQRIPNYFNPAFQTNYQTFIKATIAHYASNPNVGYIRFGLGRGGETLPVGGWDNGGPCSQQFAAWGLTDSTITTTWEPYLKSMLDFEANNNPSHVQLMVGMTPMSGTNVPAFIATTAIPLKIGIGSQGLSKADVNNCPGSTADWCDLFSQYTGQVPLELQTVGQSCMNGGCPTGSLTQVLPWAVGNKATILELYYQDWLTAFDPNFSPYDSSGGYKTAITNAATGQ